MKRDAALILFGLAVIAFGVAFVSMLSTEVDVWESAWITAGLLVTAVAFFLKELH